MRPLWRNLFGILFGILLALAILLAVAALGLELLLGSTLVVRVP